MFYVILASHVGKTSQAAVGSEQSESCSENRYMDDYGEHGEEEETVENYTISKEEAAKFWNAIRKYCDQCVKAEKTCMASLTSAESATTNANEVKQGLQELVANTKSEGEKVVTEFRKNSDSAREHCLQIAKERIEVTNVYDKMVFSATHAEGALSTAMNIFNTATEILDTNELVHKMRAAFGDVHIPFKLSADLKKIQRNITEFQTSCKKNKFVMKYFADLASSARKLGEIEAIIRKKLEESNRVGGYPSCQTDKVIPCAFNRRNLVPRRPLSSIVVKWVLRTQWR